MHIYTVCIYIHMYTCMVYYLLWRPLLLTSPTQTCERICSQTSHLCLQVERWDQLERRGTFQSHHKEAAAHTHSNHFVLFPLGALKGSLSLALSRVCALSLPLSLCTRKHMRTRLRVYSAFFSLCAHPSLLLLSLSGTERRLARGVV